MRGVGYRFRESGRSAATGAGEAAAPAPRALPLWSVRNRLVLLFFAITAAAVGFVYLYVVPQLSSSLTAERLARLEAVAEARSERLGRAMERGVVSAELRRLVRRLAQSRTRA